MTKYFPQDDYVAQLEAESFGAAISKLGKMMSDANQSQLLATLQHIH